MKKTVILALMVAATQAITVAAQPNGPASGASTPASAPASRPAVPGQYLEPADTLRISIRFGGGRVSDYIRQIKEAAKGQPVNVAFGADAAAAELAPIELDNVDLRTALEAIIPASAESSIQFSISVLGAMKPPGDQSLAYAVMTRTRSQPSEHHQEVRVSSIRQYLGDVAGEEAVKKAGVLVSAIEAALALNPAEPHSWQVKFHADSGLLILRGTSDEISIAQVVVNEIVGDVKDTNREHAALVQARRVAEENFNRAQDMMKAAEKGYLIAEDALKKVKREQPDGDAIGAAEQRLAAAEEEVQYRRDQLRACERVLLTPTMDPAAGRIRDMERMIEDLQAEIKRLRSELSARSGKPSK